MTDSASQALLHQWFPDLYPAPDLGVPVSVPGAPSQPPAAPIVPDASTIVADSIGANGNGTGGAFDGTRGAPGPGAPSSTGPAGAFSGTGSVNTNSAPGDGAFGNKALSTVGNIGLGIGQNYATNALSAATGIPSAGIGAGVNVAKSLYDAVQADQALSNANQPGLTMGEVIGATLGNLDPTQGIASTMNGLASLSNNVLGTDLNTAHQGLVNSITGAPSLSDIESMANATAAAQANAQGLQDINDAATAFHDLMAGVAPGAPASGPSAAGAGAGGVGAGGGGPSGTDGDNAGASASDGDSGQGGGGGNGNGDGDGGGEGHESGDGGHEGHDGEGGGGGEGGGDGGGGGGGGGDARGGLIRGAFDQTPHLAGPQHVHPAILAALQAQFINRNRGAFG